MSSKPTVTSFLSSLAACVLVMSPASAGPCVVEDALGGRYFDCDGKTPQNHAAGLISVYADGVSFSRTVPPSDTAAIEMLAGRKNLAAGVDTWQAFAFVRDSHGNLVTDGTQATLHAGGSTLPITVTNGVAVAQALAGTRAGLLHIHATASAVQSGRETLVISAGLPEPESMQLATAEAVVDFDTMAEINSAILSDKYGNKIVQGTSGTTFVQDEQGHMGLLPTGTDNGVLSAWLPVRKLGGHLKFHPVIGTVSGNAGNMQALRANIPDDTGIAVAVSSSGAYRIKIGPIRTARGYELPDGLRFNLNTDGASSTGEKIAYSVGGYVTFEGTALGGMVAMLEAEDQSLSWLIKIPGDSGRAEQQASQTGSLP